MDVLPPALLRPEPEIMIAGFPMRKIVGHHSPGSARSEDVKNAVEDLAFGMDVRAATQSERRGGQEELEDFPLVFGQT
jgi:hypothetical protein